MISQAVEYSLRAMFMLARNPKQPCTVRQLAEMAQVPGAYLAKLMQGLVRAGLVESQRGLHGGFMLAKEPAEVTIWDIVDVVDPVKRIRTCPLNVEEHGVNLCPLHRRLDQALAQIEASFRATTLAELLEEADPEAPLCRPLTGTNDPVPPPADRTKDGR